MYRRLEAAGSRLLGLFVPAVEAGACGGPVVKWYPACWQCASRCGYNAGCFATCRSGCGCTVDTDLCDC
ncbi:MAG: hypothetical protein ACJ73S_24405 [Mycobacteriales bacterium]